MAVLRICLSFCILFVASFLLCRPCAAEPLLLEARAAALMDFSSGRILYVKNLDAPVQPASLTKILSLYLVYQTLHEGRAHPSDRVRVSKKAWRTGGSRMFVEPGTEVALEELMKGMAVVSANDATVAVAEHLGESVDGFVKMMNRTAHLLGMNHSQFKNPHGLPARGQFTTAGDILNLSRSYLQSFPEALQLHSMKQYTYHEISQHNRNMLLKMCPDVDGIKTGYIHAAGYHIVATAKRGNTRLIAVVMGAKTARIRTREATKLLEFGFRLAEEKRPPADAARSLRSAPRVNSL